MITTLLLFLGIGVIFRGATLEVNPSGYRSRRMVRSSEESWEKVHSGEAKMKIVWMPCFNRIESAVGVSSLWPF